MEVNVEGQDTRRDVWENPLATRYASADMARLWSDRNRYRTWRQVWLALAEAEAELGLPITQAQLQQLRAALEPVDFVKAAAYEKQMRHDVFAHLAREHVHRAQTQALVRRLELADELLDLGPIHALSLQPCGFRAPR